MKLTNLETEFLGRNYIFYDKIDSTQSEIWRRIENGTLIMADIQTKGKGTHGRIWHTNKNNIAFSFYIRTDCNLTNLNGITTEIAKIIVDIFKDEYNINLNIKEPNDIMFNSKKICGILTESKINAKKIEFLVVGIGINIEEQNFTEDIKNLATSIKKEFGIEIDRTKFIEDFCNRFEKSLKERIKR